MESKKLVNFESGTIVKYFVVKNKVEVESTQFKRQQVETGESLFVSQTAEAWNALGKLPLHLFKNINILFKTWAPHDRTILNKRTYISDESFFEKSDIPTEKTTE